MQWQFSTDSGSSWSPIKGATSATYTFSASALENGWQFRAVFDNALGQATSEAATLTVASAATNWSGEVATGTSFRFVTGAWTVPAVDCSAGASTYSSVWVGLDGYGDSSVEQDGTEQDCSGNVPFYGAWYEMYGDSSVNSGYEVQLAYPVSPGDEMQGSVSYSSGSGSFTLSIADLSANWSYTSPPFAFSAQQSSAEWIVERPAVGCSSCFATLSDYGSTSFADAAASPTTPSGAGAQSAGSLGASPIDMESGSTIISATGALDATREGFPLRYESG